jgi:hypothetical protein
LRDRYASAASLREPVDASEMEKSMEDERLPLEELAHKLYARLTHDSIAIPLPRPGFADFREEVQHLLRTSSAARTLANDFLKLPDWRSYFPLPSPSSVGEHEGLESFRLEVALWAMLGRPQPRAWGERRRFARVRNASQQLVGVVPRVVRR